MPMRTGFAGNCLSNGGLVMERTERIAEELKKEISNIIRNTIKDPRLPGFVSVTAVRVTKDLRYAKAYISVYGKDKEKQDAIQALNHAAGFVRREIGNRIKLRYTPELTFHLDNSIEHGIHISNLIDKTLYPDNE
jgi:ribosome-binding factor A